MSFVAKKNVKLINIYKTSTELQSSLLRSDPGFICPVSTVVVSLPLRPHDLLRRGQVGNI